MDPPKAIVRRKIKDILRQRVGRGFSINEVKVVGLTIREARRLGLYIDERRRSKRDENIEILRNYLSSIRRLESGEKEI
ncbi:MAG: ribosomal protein L13e [Aigarchaeota archaeon]|nr:ribosomal protein L13e [Aigarchaeota archaeon]MDW7985875.1 ribosomal protein L13e [Nitrososphaerota archaeon]